MDNTAAGLIGLIRATATFARCGDSSPVPLPGATRAAAENANHALVHMLILHVRQAGEAPCSMRVTHDLVREFDGLLAVDVGTIGGPGVMIALWEYRCALAARLRSGYGEGGELSAETLDMLQAAKMARAAIEKAYERKREQDELARLPRAKEDDTLRSPPEPQPQEAPEPDPAAPPPPAEAPRPAEPQPAPEPAPAAEAPAPILARVEGDAFRFPGPIPAVAVHPPAVTTTPAMQQTPTPTIHGLLSVPPRPSSRNTPAEDAKQAEADRDAEIRARLKAGKTGRLYSGLLRMGDMIASLEKPRQGEPV